MRNYKNVSYEEMMKDRVVRKIKVTAGILMIAVILAAIAVSI